MRMLREIYSQHVSCGIHKHLHGNICSCGGNIKETDATTWKLFVNNRPPWRILCVVFLNLFNFTALRSKLPRTVEYLFKIMYKVNIRLLNNHMYFFLYFIYSKKNPKFHGGNRHSRYLLPHYFARGPTIPHDHPNRIIWFPLQLILVCLNFPIIENTYYTLCWSQFNFNWI